MNTYKALAAPIFISLIILMVPVLAFAHATVAPSQTAPSKYETFSVSVPTERDVPTTGIRLIVPESLDRFTPVVKPGWKITLKKDGERVTEVEWTGGSIPDGQKDFFQFTARTTSTPATLIWKVHQTYRGGEVVAWDQDPRGSDQGSLEHPYSITEVAEIAPPQKNKKDKLALVLSLGALIISIGAMVVAIRK